MSERSELQQHGAIFAAQRRSAHWCQAASMLVDPPHSWMVHQ